MSSTAPSPSSSTIKASFIARYSSCSCLSCSTLCLASSSSYNYTDWEKIKRDQIFLPPVSCFPVLPRVLAVSLSPSRPLVSSYPPLQLLLATNGTALQTYANTLSRSHLSHGFSLSLLLNPLELLGTNLSARYILLFYTLTYTVTSISIINLFPILLGYWLHLSSGSLDSG